MIAAPEIRVRRAVRRAAVVLLCLGLLASPALAQQGAPELDPLDHAYSVYLGSGLYVFNGRSVFVFRIAPKFRVRSEEEHAFGIRVRINATFGFYNLDLSDLVNLEFPDRIGTFAFVPGIEFPIKIKDNWTLMPFLDFGVASDTGFHEITYVLGTGARSRAHWRDSRHHYVLWNEAVYTNNFYTTVEERRSYGFLRSDMEMREMVDFKLGKRPFDLGVLAKVDFYVNRLDLVAPFEPPDDITWRWELGLTIGPSDKWQVAKKLFTVPRFGLSYRGGSGTSGIRFIIRSRY